MLGKTPDLRMDEFLHKIRALTDSLATSGETLKEIEVIDVVLGGLGSEYNNFVTNIMSRSSTEAEYKAMVNITAEIRWFLSFFREQHIPIMSLSVLKCDSCSAIFLASNPVIRSKSRYVEIDFHFIFSLENG